MENKELVKQENKNTNIGIFDFDINFTRREDGNIPYWKRGIGFLIGSIGLIVLEFILVFIIYAFTRDQETLNAALTYAVYGTLLVIFVIYYWKNIKTLFKQLLDFQVIIRGVIFGILVITIPTMYYVLVNPLFDVSVNANEQTLRTMIDSFPWLTLLFAGVFGPICEEFTYRVSLFGLLRKKKVLAYIISIIIFGLIHFNFESFGNADQFIVEIINLPNYIIAGLILVYAYDKYGFGVAVIAHMLNNVVAILFQIMG